MSKSNHIFHTLPAIPDFPLITSAKGIHLYSKEGTQYWALFATPMACTLGYGNEEMADHIYKQLKKTSFAYRSLNESEEVVKAAEDMVEFTGNDLDRFFFVSGGSEAVEGMIKIARQYWMAKGYPRKYKVLTRMKSYHGSTNGALAASGHKDKELFDPYMVNMGNFSECFCYRCPYGLMEATCDCECAKDLEREIMNQGVETVAAVMIETMSGAKLGLVEAPTKYYKMIREICNKYHLLLMLDEVFIGAGRSGFNCTYTPHGIKPDVIAMGKAISGGYYPVGLLGTTKEIGDLIEGYVSYFEPGHTWCMNPVGASVISKTIEIYKRDGLVEKVAQDGIYLKGLLEDVKSRHECIGDVRGKGFMWCVEYVADREQKTAIDVSGNPYGMETFSNLLIMIGMQKGIQFFCSTNVDGTTIGPHYITTREELATMIGLYEECIIQAEMMLGMK
jgi:adenosylmethionine-8-amino-7-oxononanoate aminotransferase